MRYGPGRSRNTTYVFLICEKPANSVRHLISSRHMNEAVGLKNVGKLSCKKVRATQETHIHDPDQIGNILGPYQVREILYLSCIYNHICPLLVSSRVKAVLFWEASEDDASICRS